jgi:cell division protein FtsA
MSKNRIIAALDIGSSKITTLVAQVITEPITFETTVNIVGVASSKSQGIKKGQIVNIEEAVESIIDSVEAAERMAGYSLSNAYVSVGGAHISSQNSTGVVAISNPDGEIGNEDVERVIEAARAISLPASREIIHVVPREYIVDGEPGVRDPVGMSGVRLEVDTHLITASSPALKNLAKTVNEVGIEIEEVVFNGLASAYACLSSTEKELGCALVDIGSGVTSIAGYVDGALSYSGAIPIGARNVTNDLAIGLRVSLETAEKVKIKLSKDDEESIRNKENRMIEIKEEASKEVKKVQKRTLTDGIIKPRLNEIFTIIKLDLEKAGIINRIPSGLIVTGGGALTFGIAESAKRVTGLPVRIAEPGGVGGLTDDIIHPSFSAPIGLTLYGATREQMNMAQGATGGSTKKIKLPSKAIFGKITDTIKDLLP